MKRLFAKWLSVLLVICLSLAIVPTALMEETVEPQMEILNEALQEEVEVMDPESADVSSEDEAISISNSAEEVIDDREEEQDTEIVEVDAVDEYVEEESVDFIDEFVLDDQEVEESDFIIFEPQPEEVTNEESMFLAEAAYNFDVLDNSTSFSVQGKNISASLVNNQYNCWTYARMIYEEIWGKNVKFESDFTGSASMGWNSLRQLSDSDRTLTVDHLKAYVSNAQLGATLRVCGCTSGCSAWGNDGLTCGHKGHSVIIVQKDDNGFTTVENAYPAGQSSYAVCTRYYSWQGFINWWGTYGCSYIKYIKWPNAPIYNGASSQGTSYSTLKFINVSYPKTFKIDTSYGWVLSGGTLGSDVALSSIKSEILYANGTLLSAYGPIAISGNSFSVSNINSGVKFSQISNAGDYIWRLTATDSMGRTLAMDMPVKAVNSGSSITATMSKDYTNDSNKTNNGSNSSSNQSKKNSTPTITVTKNAKYKVNVGTKYQIVLKGKTAKSYKTSKKKIATVSSSGLITPKAQGKAKITIKLTNKKKYTLTLTVVDPTIPKSISLDKSGTLSAKKGQSTTLTAKLPAGTKSPIKWATSNWFVATVSNGVVTFKRAGKVTITATATRGKKKAKVTFKVSK